MEYRKRFVQQMSNIGQAYTRYPLTMILFIALSVVNAFQIVNEMSGYERYVHGLLVGILLTMVASHINERFIEDTKQCWVILTGSMLIAILYYMILPKNNTAYLMYEVRTAVLVFALFIAFIWIPSIKNNITHFYQYFLAAFKYGFTTLLYSLILTLGFQLIISSVDNLLFSVDYDYMIHAANIIWFIFAPSYFLSLVPPTDSYSQANEVSQDIPTENLVEETEAFAVTKFLKILINYIVIPLIGIYTFILVAYILLNIRGEFWTDNLLEPMLISYTIIIMIVYLVASNMSEPIANYFRKIFPKIMIPIVVFQTIASVMKIREMGITHGRYYVILFGIFALIVGLIFSFLVKEKAGLIVPFLVVLAVISVTPPIDAFTVAKNSQKRLLTTTLEDNEMLQDNQVQQKPTINQKDKEKITASTDYLYSMEYTDEVAFLPKDFNVYDDFVDVFGFPMTYEDTEPDDSLNQYAYFDRSSSEVMVITEEDYFLELYLANYEEETNEMNIEINEDYTLQTKNSLPYFELVITDATGEEILLIDLEPLFKQAFAAASQGSEMLVNEEDMTLIVENEELRVRILALDLMKNEDDSVQSINAQLYLFITVKD